MGDWNADMLDSESSDCRFVRSLIDELSLKLIDTGPSYHIANKDIWIYILLTVSNDSFVIYDRKLPTFLSGRDIISVTIETFRPETRADSYNYRCIGKNYTCRSLPFVQNKDWSVISLPENEFDMEGGLTSLTDNLQEATNTLDPEKTFKPRKHVPPWLNAELRLLILKRDATNRRHSRTGSRQILAELIDLDNTC